MQKKKRDRHTSGFMIRLPESYREPIKAAARTNQRPLTWEIRAMICKALEMMGIQPPVETE